MAQPTENDLKQRDSQSTITNTVITRVNGVAVKETISTRTIDDEMIYKDGAWREQDETTKQENNI